MKETCGYCDLNETGTYAGSGFLWGRDLTGEYDGEFNIVKSKHNGKHYLKYADDESENTSEIILFSSRFISLAVYGTAILKFCTYIVPYALFQYYPLTYLLGRTDSPLCALAPLAAPLFALPCWIVWRVGVRKYQSAGS